MQTHGEIGRHGEINRCLCTVTKTHPIRLLLVFMTSELLSIYAGSTAHLFSQLL